jgi:non-specific serine/threonine protein kinase
LPLAIELAAARIKLLPPPAMLARLEHRLQLLTGGPLDLPARQQSLRQTLDWSYNLLELGEQRLFRRLAVFVGGFTIEAAEAVANLAGELPLDSLANLAALMAKSLIRQEEQPDGEPRLWMLETMREYALEQLEASGEAMLARRSHAAFFLALAQTAEPYLIGPQQGLWLDRLEREHNNLRAALRWAEERGDDSELEIGLLLAAALGRFWTYRGHLVEGRDRLAKLLALASGSSREMAGARAQALTAAGLLAIRRSDYEAAGQLLQAALPLWEAQGETGQRGMALTLDSLGWVASAFGQFARAQSLYEASLELYRQAGAAGANEAADALAHLAMVAFFDGDLERARVLLEESLSIKRTQGDRWGAGFALFHLGCVAIAQQHYPAARAHLMEGMALSAALGERLLRAFMLEALAWLALESSEARGPARAAQIFGAAQSVRESLGAPRPPQWRALLEGILDKVRAGLGERGFAAALAAGNRLSPDEAIALFEQAAPSQSPNALTARELEVLHWVADGLTDAQVAEKLVISVRTVHAHLQAIYGKLGVSSRTAAIRAASELDK